MNEIRGDSPYRDGDPIPRVLFSVPKPLPAMECNVVYVFYDGEHVATLRNDLPDGDVGLWWVHWATSSVYPEPSGARSLLQDLEVLVLTTIAHNDGWRAASGASPAWTDDGYFDPSRLPDGRRPSTSRRSGTAGRDDGSHGTSSTGTDPAPERIRKADRNLGQAFLGVAAEIDRDRSVARSPESPRKPG